MLRAVGMTRRQMRRMIRSLIAFAVVAAVAGVLAAIGPARRASRLDVLKALQYE
jgi:putative ABC transport system permease protein